MKILFITHYSDLYGANKSLADLIKGLEIFKVIPVVLLPAPGPFSVYLKSNNIDYTIRRYRKSHIPINENYSIFRKLKFFKDELVSLLYIIKLIRKSKIDMVWSNSSVITVGLFAAILSFKQHVWHIREFGREDYDVKYIYGNRMFNILLNRSTITIGISKKIFECRLKNLKNSMILHDGVVPIDEIILKPKSINCNQLITFSIIGLISEKKGQQEAINAFMQFCKINENSKLLIVGSGDDKIEKELKKLARISGLGDKIEFLGYINEIEEIYKRTDILLMCSSSEALGRVTIEAMAYGIPVIGKNTGATPEIIVNKYNGLLYDNESNLVDKMLQLVNNSNDYQSYSLNAIQTVKDKFTIEKYAEILFKIIKGL